MTSRARLYVSAAIVAGMVATGILAASQEPIPSSDDWGTDTDCAEYEDRDRDRAIGGGITAALVLTIGAAGAYITERKG